MIVGTKKNILLSISLTLLILGYLMFSYKKKIGSVETKKKVNTYYNSGQVKSVETYKNSLKDGECRYYFENGKLSGIYIYSNGVKHGMFQTFYENGVIRSEGTILNDTTLDGNYSIYDINGKPLRRIKYENNKEINN